jgi:hypothetical protein
MIPGRAIVVGKNLCPSYLYSRDRRPSSIPNRGVQRRTRGHDVDLQGLFRNAIRARICANTLGGSVVNDADANAVRVLVGVKNNGAISPHRGLAHALFPQRELDEGIFGEFDAHGCLATTKVAGKLCPAVAQLAHDLPSAFAGFCCRYLYHKMAIAVTVKASDLGHLSAHVEEIVFDPAPALSLCCLLECQRGGKPLAALGRGNRIGATDEEQRVEHAGPRLRTAMHGSRDA